jgi:hypothetical protein
MAGLISSTSKPTRPQTGPVDQTYPKYAVEVRIYGKLLEIAGILKIAICAVACCLPLTARFVDSVISVFGLRPPD